jgi:hypothetical protein
MGDKLAWQLTDAINSLSIPKEQTDLIHDAAAVAKFFNVSLTIPSELRESDVRNIKILYRIATGKEFTDVKVDIPCQKLGSLSDEEVRQLSSKDISAHLEIPDCWQILKVFGRDVETGPVAMDISGCEVNSLEKFKSCS